MSAALSRDEVRLLVASNPGASVEVDERPTATTRIAPGAMTQLVKEILAAGESSASAVETVPPGTVIGRFLLLRELGRGGFGVVYEARDQQLLRGVAFKLILPNRARLGSDQLLREAETIAQLSHPNLVTLFDVGRSEHGAYLVLELLRGQTLAKRLRRGPLQPDEGIRVVREIARGLAHAHEHGVVHRDLKPSNVFLCDGSAVKLLDFGLAQAFGRRGPEGGTPSYMAPEQWRGAPEDERTDVFAFGVLLYAMLSGELPFPDDGGKSLAGTAPAPALHVPECPELAALVARALEKDPVDRPRDAGELLHALEAIPIATLLPSPTSATSRDTSIERGDHRGGPLVPAAPTDPPSVRLQPPAPPSPTSLAVLPLANLSGDPAQEYFSDGMTDEIVGKLSRLAGLAVTARTSVARYKGSEQTAREIGAELGVAYLLEGSVRRAGDRIRVSANLVKTADGFQIWSEHIDSKLDDIFDVQERVATRIVEALHVRLTPDEAHALGHWGTRNVAAYDEYLRGQVLVEHFHMKDKLEAARGHFERALRIDPRFAPALAGLASAEAQSYRNVDSKPERLPRAEALVTQALAVDPGLVRALFTAGELCGVRYDYAGAAAKFRQVLAIEPRNYAAWDYLGWALGYMTPPAVEEAERACRTAIQLNPSFAEAHYHLVRALVPQGRLAEADQAIAELEEHYPASDLVCLGRFWIAMAAKRPREALASLGQSKRYDATNLWRAFAAMALAQLGERDQAFAALEEALARGYRDSADLRGNAYYDPLRGDPRFAELLRKLDVEVALPSPNPRAPAPSPSS